ncbi:hypothetical protein PO124_07855 [Bacillus licheniformis]|nr:hypothetical protein [Bacillus licheniformis]
MPFSRGVQTKELARKWRSFLKNGAGLFLYGGGNGTVWPLRVSSRPFRQLTAEDHDIVKRVMKQTDTLRFAQNPSMS